MKIQAKEFFKKPLPKNAARGARSPSASSGDDVATGQGLVPTLPATIAPKPAANATAKRTRAQRVAKPVSLPVVEIKKVFTNLSTE